MGNIGRSSTGCGLCRKRKIKCDEGKPGCKRCAQIRKPCPGYPYQVQLEIRQLGTQSPAGPSHQHTIPESSIFTGDKSKTLPAIKVDDSQFWTEKVKAEASTDKVPLHKLAPAHTSITPPPRYDLHHQSLCFFLNLFCYQAGRLYSFPVLDFLPTMLEKAAPYSSLSLAANAVSRMTLADRYSGSDVRLQTGKDYGYALKSTKATMLDSSATIQDETVIAVWLLGLYELISVVLTHGRASIGSLTAEEEWQSHILHVRGAMNLLRLRGLIQFENPVSEKVFRILKAAIQLRLFILTSVTGKEFDDLEIDVYQEEHEFVPSETANKATRYFHRTARHLEKIRLFLAAKPYKPNQMKDYKSLARKLVQYGRDLDNSMIDWSKGEPAWDMMEIRAATSGTMWAFYPSHAVYYFYSFWIFLYHLRFLTARVKLYEGLIELAKLDLDNRLAEQGKPTTSTKSQVLEFQEMIQATAADLIGLTAYALGDVTPMGDFNSSVSRRSSRTGPQEINVIATMQLVIPLKMLQRSEYPTATQKGAVDLAISHIGDGFRRQPVGLA